MNIHVEYYCTNKQKIAKIYQYLVEKEKMWIYKYNVSIANNDNIIQYKNWLQTCFELFAI